MVIQGCVQGTLATGEMLSAMQATHVGLVWWTCRKVIHLWAGLPEGDFEDIDPFANEAVDSQKVTITSTPATGTSQVKDRILKMSNVMDQADDSELTLASQADIDAWMNSYVAVMGAPPLEEEEPNEAQLSALNRRCCKGHMLTLVCGYPLQEGRRKLSVFELIRLWATAGIAF